MGEAAMVRSSGLALAGTQRHEEGQEMLVARMGLNSLGLEAAIFDQAGGILGGNPIGQPIVEAGGPGRWVLAINPELPQIMNRPAARQDQDAFLAQRLERPTHRQVMPRSC